MNTQEAMAEITAARNEERHADLRGAYLRGADLRGADGIVEIGGEDWSLYLIRRTDAPPFIKGGLCCWFETRAEAEAHWNAHTDNAHGKRMLDKLNAAWAYVTAQGWIT